MKDFKAEWIRYLLEEQCELVRTNNELEEHIEKCERLLRCWIKYRTKADTHELTEETKEFLNITQ